MKTVFQSSSEVIHLFANKSQTHAKNQTRNAFFERSSLYSYGYHYKLALHLDGGAILINNGGYSVTTSKHIGEIQHASRHKKQFYSEDIFIKNALRRTEKLVSKLPRAKSRKLEYIATIKGIFNHFQDFQRYAKSNKIEFVRWSNSDFIKAQIDKRSKDWKRFLYIAKSMDNITILEKEAKEEEQKQKNKRERRQKQLIRMYRLGKSDFVRLDYDLLSLQYDKQNLDNEERYFIHTSQNVKISLEEGQKAIKALEFWKWNDEKINANLKGQKIGYYTITKAQNKTLYIGCHKIKFAEIQRLAKDLKKVILLLSPVIEEIEDIPGFEGTLKQLNNLNINN